MNSKNILLTIRRIMPSLNPALKRIAEYILKNPDKIKLLKIKELAAECKVSEATVTRFVKEIKIISFQALKISIAEMTANDIKDTYIEEKFVYDDVKKNDSIESIIEKIVFRNVEALQCIGNIVNPLEIKKAVSAIDKANYLIFYCIGTSTIAAESAKMRFYRVGKKSIVYSDPANQAVSASLLDKKSVAIGISASGESKPTVNSLKMAKECGAETICVTNSDKSSITQYADIKLVTFTEESPFFQESLVSRVVQILILDILYASYAVKNYEKSIESVGKSAKALKKVLR